MSAEKLTNPVPEEQVDNQIADDTIMNFQSEESVEQVVEESAQEPAEESSEEVVEESAQEPAEESSEEVVEESVQEPAEESSEEIVEESTQEVDFSDEEADLAANSPDLDLGEEIAEAEADDDREIGYPTESTQYAGQSKEELVSAFETALAEKPVQAVRRDAEQIKLAFYKVYRAEVEQLRRLFIEAGGKAEDFAAPDDASERRLKELFAEYRSKRDQALSKIEDEKEKNYKIKLQIIEELKELINSSETLNHTFNTFRDLQTRWKETGLVPQAHMKDIWETYNLHVENFYNFIKINKELRDLDLKKNYEAKLQLAEDAEALILEPSVINSFHKLQKLHELWRETGPVANEYKEQLWERFREASSKINKRHQEYFENIKDEQKRNLDLKTELCVKTEELAAQPYASRKEWNKASDQLIEIQKVWKTIGFAPKKDNAHIYERFRKACDSFFENKKNFYSHVKGEMDENLLLKNEICAQAEALKESEDWKATTDELIALQKKWKEIGPISRKHSDAVWKRFRSACDSFFEKKSAHFSNVGTQYEDNLAQKKQIIAQLKEIIAEGKDCSFDQIKEIQRNWSAIGFVPIKQKDAVAAEYRKLIDELFAKLRGGERDRKMDRFRGKVSGMKEGGQDRRVKTERDRLYNRLKQVESDIAVLENNIGFFSKSKNAESMIKDVNSKIEKMRAEMEEVTEKINVIDKQGE